MDYSLPGYSVHGILQAGILVWRSESETERKPEVVASPRGEALFRCARPSGPQIYALLKTSTSLLIDSYPVPSSLQPLPVSALRLFCFGAAQHHCWTGVPHDCKGAFENVHPSHQFPKEELQQHLCLETSPGATQLCARWWLCKPARAPHGATASRLQGTPGCSFLPPCPCLSLPFHFIIFNCGKF